MGECKAKAIQTNLGTFRHNQTYPGKIQAYSDLEPCVYLEPRYIQNTGIFKIWGIFRTLPHICNETLIIFTAIIIFINYNYFRKACRIEINILR